MYGCAIDVAINGHHEFRIAWLQLDEISQDDEVVCCLRQRNFAVANN